MSTSLFSQPPQCFFSRPMNKAAMVTRICMGSISWTSSYQGRPGQPHSENLTCQQQKSILNAPYSTTSQADSGPIPAWQTCSLCHLVGSTSLSPRKSIPQPWRWVPKRACFQVWPLGPPFSSRIPYRVFLYPTVTLLSQFNNSLY